MRILAIESSCDESAVAVLDAKQGLLSHTLFSQIELHRVYGGVVPELASRDHVRRLLPLLRQALHEADTDAAQLSGVAYTAGPGLVGALLVGAAVAQSYAFAQGLPTVAVHHLEGHLLAPLLEDDPPPFPHLALLVSGELARLAVHGRSGVFDFPRPMLDRPGLEFSFSGLKTAVALAARAQPLDEVRRADIARGVQDAIVETLAHRLAMLLLAEFDVAWVKLTVNKPGAIRGSRDVGITLERHRSNGPAA